MGGNQAERVSAFNLNKGISTNRIKFLSGRMFSFRIAIIALLSIVILESAAN